MKTIAHLIILTSLFCFATATSSFAAPNRFFRFYIDPDCGCSDELNNAASYWNTKVNVILREVPDIAHADVVFAKTSVRKYAQRVVTLSDEIVADSYWLTNTVGKRVLGFALMADAITYYGKNTLKPQEVLLEPVPDDAPQHIKDLRNSIEERLNRIRAK